MEIRLPKMPNPPRMGMKFLSKIAVKVFNSLTGQEVQLENEKFSMEDLELTETATSVPISYL